MSKPIGQITGAWVDEMQQLAIHGSALEKFNAHLGTDDCDALERLRFFLSLALNQQDWIDVEPFLDAMGFKGAATIARESRIKKAWEPVIYEIHRRADKECGEESDFTVTISAAEYSASVAAEEK